MVTNFAKITLILKHVCIMDRQNLIFALVCGFILAIFCSCFRKFERPKWDTDLLTPIAKTKLSIDNLLKDSLVEKQIDSSYKIVYRQVLDSVSTDTIVPLNGKEYVKSILLKDFELNSSSVYYKLSLGQVAANAGPPLSFIIPLSNGQRISIPQPGYLGLKAGPVTLNADKIFSSADVLSGRLEILIKNQLNFTITNITYNIKNTVKGDILGTKTIASIAPGESKIEEIDLSGKFIEGFLDFNVTNLDIPGTAPNRVLIDTAKGLDLTITARNLKVSYAQAIFPKQDVVNDTIFTEITNLGDKKLKRAATKSGFVDVTVESTAPDTIFFKYKIWDAKIGNDTFVVNAKTLPAPEGTTSKQTFTYNLDGFDLNLSGENGDSSNFFRSQLIASFDSTGRLVEINGNDSIRITIKVYNVKPSYAKGYFGKTDFKVGPGDIAISTFKGIKSGKLDFDEIKMKLKISNGAGIPCKLILEDISAQNTVSNSSQKLILQNSLDQVSIKGATETPFSFTETNVEINKTNSNLTDFINVFPNKISYTGTLTTNPDGDDGSFSNFLSSESNVVANLDIEIPLSFIATDLALTDTIDFITSSIKTPENIKSGIFSLIVENGFPLSLNMKLYLLDENDVVFDELITTQPVLPAITNAAGRVTEKKYNKLDYVFDQTRFKNIFKAKKILVIADFSTPTDNKFYKLYSDYSIDIKMVGDFKYTLD